MADIFSSTKIDNVVVVRVANKIRTEVVFAAMTKLKTVFVQNDE